MVSSPINGEKALPIASSYPFPVGSGILMFEGKLKFGLDQPPQRSPLW